MMIKLYKRVFSNTIGSTSHCIKGFKYRKAVTVQGKYVTKQTGLSRQHGSSLIEALVSLFVFSVGALGIAALQTTSLVRNDDTRSRSIVIWKAQDLIDRMRATKTVFNVTGDIGAYVTAINNDGQTIGDFDVANNYPCGAQPQACDTVDCNPDELVTFNLWDVFCNTSTGLSPVGAVQDGSSAVRNLEVALVQNGNEYQLYFEWLNRAATNNVDENINPGAGPAGADTGLGGGARLVQTNLCGTIVPVDARLDTHCVRFQ